MDIPLRLKLHYLPYANIWNIKCEGEIAETEDKQTLA